MEPLTMAALFAGGSAAGNMFSSLFGESTPKIPQAYREQVLRAMAQLGMMQQIRQPYQYQRTAPLSPFQLAAMGNMANQAFVQGAPAPTTSATQGADYWQQAMGKGAPAPAGAAQGVPQAQGAPAPAPAQGAPPAPAQGASGLPGGAEAFNPYANLGYAAQFIPPAVLGLFAAPGVGPKYADPTWSNYYANTPAGQEQALKLDPRLYQSNPWASSHPDKAMALQDPAWVAAHPDKAAKYQQMFDASQQPVKGA